MALFTAEAETVARERPEVNLLKSSLTPTS